MNNKVIKELFLRYTGALYSLLFFAFLGLARINTSFNFDLKSASIYDAAPSVSTFSELKKLTPVDDSLVALSSSYVSNVPRTSASLVSAPRAASASNIFTINNPTTVSNPSIDAGYGVLRYNNGSNGGRFLYGHSSLAFNRLKTTFIGDKINVEMDSAPSTYVVSARVVFNKSSELDNNSGRRLALYNAKYNGTSYDLALMTCGNGTNDDPNFRLVLFLTKI